jgi:hypothetical protein
MIDDIVLENWAFADVAFNIGINMTKMPLRPRQLESGVRKRPVFRSDRDYHRLGRIWNWIGKSVREPG